MYNVIKRELMENLTCEHLTISYNDTLECFFELEDCIIHILSGDASIIMGDDDSTQWQYPIKQTASVWIPSKTVFKLLNAGVGTLHLNIFKYIE